MYADSDAETVALVRSTPYSVGFVDYSNAAGGEISIANLIESDNVVVRCTTESVSAAAVDPQQAVSGWPLQYKLCVTSDPADMPSH
jgi:ABC-type phosphate transport system substrate-binding protein